MNLHRILNVGCVAAVVMMVSAYLYYGRNALSESQIKIIFVTLSPIIVGTLAIVLYKSKPPDRK